MHSRLAGGRKVTFILVRYQLATSLPNPPFSMGCPRYFQQYHAKIVDTAKGVVELGLRFRVSALSTFPVSTAYGDIPWVGWKHFFFFFSFRIVWLHTRTSATTTITTSRSLGYVDNSTQPILEDQNCPAIGKSVAPSKIDLAAHIPYH